MPVDAGTSTELMAISAVVIGDGIPVLAKGDVVNVYVASQLVDYSKGRAPVVVRCVCVARDGDCLDGLRRMQNGKVSGVEINGAYPVASHRKLSPPIANCGCASLKSGCRGEVAAVLQ
jgi:hypothetical protein